jgi:hypothetical protein
MDKTDSSSSQASNEGSHRTPPRNGSGCATAAEKTFVKNEKAALRRLCCFPGLKKRESCWLRAASQHQADAG